MGGAPGRGSGLLDGHDALPAQDQAQPFHDSRAAMDGPLGRHLGAAGKVVVKQQTTAGGSFSGSLRFASFLANALHSTESMTFLAMTRSDDKSEANERRRLRVCAHYDGKGRECCRFVMV